jgi:hypothetical protein
MDVHRGMAGMPRDGEQVKGGEREKAAGKIIFAEGLFM